MKKKNRSKSWFKGSKKSKYIKRKNERYRLSKLKYNFKEEVAIDSIK
jgi:hypothetical protein